MFQYIIPTLIRYWRIIQVICWLLSRKLCIISRKRYKTDRCTETATFEVWYGWSLLMITSNRRSYTLNTVPTDLIYFLTVWQRAMPQHNSIERPQWHTPNQLPLCFWFSRYIRFAVLSPTAIQMIQRSYLYLLTTATHFSWVSVDIFHRENLKPWITFVVWDIPPEIYRGRNIIPAFCRRFEIGLWVCTDVGCYIGE